MTTLEEGLRELVRELVRDEVKRALAQATAPDEYLTTIGAAKLAGVHADTVRRWIREGRLPEHRAGRLVRVRRVDLERLLAGHERPVADLSPEELARRDFG